MLGHNVVYTVAQCEKACNSAPLEISSLVSAVVRVAVVTVDEDEYEANGQRMET